MKLRLWGSALAACLLASIAGADQPVEQVGWPGVDFDPAIPTVEAVLGYAPGERLSLPGEAERYLRALADAAPDRTRLVEYARSWEGRPLHYLLVGTPETISRVDEIKAGMQALAKPAELDESRIEALVSELPAVVWLAYTVHGNELSPTGAAMQAAYHLLAARGEPFDSIRQNTLVGIDPVQNPDGLARFVNRYRETYGIEPSISAIAAERREPWPNGRTNHYIFDMNRDWLPLTQPETKGRVRVLQEFYPSFTPMFTKWGRTLLLLPASGASVQPALQRGPDRHARRLWAYERKVVRHLRLRVLHPGRLRRVLSRLWRFVARFPGRCGHDVRGRIAPGARGGAPQWRDHHLRRCRAAPLCRVGRHGGDSFGESRGLPWQLRC